MAQPGCLIQQSDCGRTAADPICPKCGLDERMRYINEEAALLAKSQAQARYWQSYAEELQAQLRKPPVPPKLLASSLGQRYQVGEVFRDLPEAPQMVVLPSGSFLMGTKEDEIFSQTNERPQHRVDIRHTVALGRYPVTFEEWDACVADGGTDHKPEDQGWGRGKRPVINVNWNDAQSYAAWLNKKLGIDALDPSRYRLPSEAEWEYACRAGTTGDYSTANGKLAGGDANYYTSDDGTALRKAFGGVLDNFINYTTGKNHERTTPVGIYAPNPWGLYDMHGNVWEWVQDCSEISYRGAPSDGSAWEAGIAHRGLRGGSYNYIANFLRSASRCGYTPDCRFDYFGFRLAKTLS